MPNTTFISLLFGLAAGSALAEVSCYTREYSDEHLASNPQQVVRDILVRLTDNPRRDGVRMSATLADQGHVAGTGVAGQTLNQGLFCLQDTDALRCGVECDGGLITVTRQDDEVLEFRTEYLVVGDTESCGGTADLAEVPGQSVTYRLFRVDPALCEGL